MNQMRAEPRDSEAESHASEGLSRASDSLETIDKQVRAFVAERPFTAVFGAVVAGYVIGRLLSKI